MRNIVSLASALLLAIVLGVASYSSAQTRPTPDAPDASAEQPTESSGEADSDAHSPDQEQVSSLLDEEARTRFQLGSTLYRQGRFDDAAREFRAAYDVSHRPELLYNLYLVQRDAGHFQEAADALRTYLHDASEVPDRGLMEGRLAALDRQIAAAEVTHTTQESGEASNADADENASNENGEAQLTQATESIGLAPPPESPSRALPIALMAGGGAVLAVGVVFAILARAKHDDLSSSCTGGVCLGEDRQGDIDTLRRDDLIADISFGVGGAAVAASLIVWLLQSAGSPERAQRAARMSAGCGAQSCGLSLEGSF